MSFVYLASPYSGTPEEQDQRYEDVCRAVALFSRWKFPVYSPIVHFHEVAKKYGLPTDVAFWLQVNATMLEAAKAIWVLKLEGWQESKGVQKELSLAKDFGLKVVYVEPLHNGDFSLT